MKIAIYCDEEWERRFLKDNLKEHELVFLSEASEADRLYADPDITCLCVFIKTAVNAETMDRFPKLQGIVTRSTGFDHIDTAEAAKRTISVSNVPAYGENTIAEYAFAMLLSLSRQIYESYNRIREDGVYSTEGLTGFDLKGRKMGIVGTGHTGQHAIRIARGFGMDVIAYDPHERKELETELEFMYVTFEDLLVQSDVISLHVPYNTHTHHLLNCNNMPHMKKGAYLINTARGAVVETKALVRSIADEAIAGAGLDVIEEESSMSHDIDLVTAEKPDAEKLQILLANQYLIDHPRVLIMPHNAFNTHEALERILRTTVENIQAVVIGTALNTVD